LAFEWLSRALDFYITEKESREIGVRWNPSPGDDIEGWASQTRIGELSRAAKGRYEQLKAQMATTRVPSTRLKLSHSIKHIESLIDRIDKLARLSPSNWVCTREDGTDYGRLWRFECIWPGQYREMLFRYIPRVILLSATLRPKTLQLLGIPKSDVDFREWPRQFPAANGPVLWIPTARVKHDMKEEKQNAWLARIREILEWGSDRKGLVHTVSYRRAREIADYLERTGFGGRLVLNGAADPDSATGREAYDSFVRSGVGTSLISPSFSTGWDFPGRRAEFQIISKIAFPDTRSKVMQARVEKDPSYPNYLAAQELVQGCGRVVRSETDRGMTFLIDDNYSWFRGLASEFCPKWFNVRKETELPKPLRRCD